jgi:predicted TIM-barrel fold metal-dependent hydrolase
VQHDPRDRFLQLKKGEKIIDYVCRHIDEGRIFLGVEGEELTIAEALRIVGNKPFVYSTDYPHEVDADTCKHELEELQENPELTALDKEAILFRNAQRFYQLTQ